MPVKRRIRKLRITPEAELQAWKVMFETGADYFHELRDFGLADDKAARRAAPKAWKRLGRDYMRTWQPDPTRQVPWALLKFGNPVAEP
jgi:hypothetical protein